MVPFNVQPPTPTPTIYTYSSPQAPIHHNPHHHHHHHPAAAYQAVKSIEFALPPTQMTPLQTHVDYKSLNTIVNKNTLPSITTTSFKQYYSPGLEYHYTEVVPQTKVVSAQPSYAYYNGPTHNYQTSYVSQPAPYFYKQPISYVPNNFVSYAKPQHQSHSYQPHQSQHYKNYYSSSIPQQLFTPASQSTFSSNQHQYESYPSSQAYNTIAYSVPLPPYDHSKRSTKATAVLSVKAPKASPTTSTKSA
jgi:hypothetical protein